MQKVRKGDTVIVLTGKDKGKVGEVLRSLPSEARVVVKGVNMARRHQRPTKVSAGGIVAKELSLQVSNVAYCDPKDRKPTRIGFRVLADGRKVRVAKRSGEILDK